MAPVLTEDEVGKTVVDAAGKELGIIASVEGRQAYVDPNPSLAEHVMAKFGWSDDEDDEDYLVTQDMLERVDQEVVLRGTI